MRDPKRIDTTLAMLRAAWTRNPDWRLGQLISNASYYAAYRDIFLIEDNAMLAALMVIAYAPEEQDDRS